MRIFITPTPNGEELPLDRVDRVAVIGASEMYLYGTTIAVMIDDHEPSRVHIDVDDLSYRLLINPDEDFSGFIDCDSDGCSASSLNELTND